MHNLNADVKNGEINLDYVKEASKNVGGALASPQKYKVVVVKSTVVPATTEKVVITFVSYGTINLSTSFIQEAFVGK